MNLKIILFSFIILFFSTNCNGKTESKHLKLKLVRYEVLQEPDDIAISSIDNCSFSDNGELFLISSIFSKNIYLYTSNYFGLIDILSPPEYLSDSLYQKGSYFRKEYQFIDPKKLRKKDPHFFFENRYTYGEFINDSTIFLCSKVSAKCELKKHGEDSTQRNIVPKWGTTRKTTVPLISYLNKNSKKYECFVLNSRRCSDDIQTSFAQANKIKYNKLKKEIYSIHETPYSMQDSLIDELIAIGRNDSKGKFIDIILPLPEIYKRTKLKYKLLNTVNVDIDDNGNVFILFPYLNKIFNASTDTNFDLTNLPSTNNELFEKIEKLKSEERSSYDYMYTLLKNEITLFTKSIFVTKNNNILVHVDHYILNEDKNQPILQLYNKEGSLIVQNTKISNKNENGKIEYIHYSKIDNKIRIFRKNAENWIIEEYEWSY